MHSLISRSNLICMQWYSTQEVIYQKTLDQFIEHTEVRFCRLIAHLLEQALHKVSAAVQSLKYWCLIAVKRARIRDSACFVRGLGDECALRIPLTQCRTFLLISLKNRKIK